MWRKILWVFTILFLLAVMLCIVSVYVSPASVKWMALCPFMLKYVLIGLAALMILWLFVNYKVAIPIAVVVFVGFKFFSHEYSIHIRIFSAFFSSEKKYINPSASSINPNG